MITVLHILHELYPSGAEMMIKNAYPYWSNKTEATIMATGVQKGPFAQTLEETGYTVVHVPSDGSGKADKIKHLFAFYKFMKTHKYDVVHIHRESLAFEYAVIAYLTGSRKICRTIHSMFAHAGKQQKIKSFTRRFMQQRLGVKFIAISDNVCANEKKVFGYTCDTVIYNWCDNHKFKYVTGTEKEIEKKKLNLDINRMTIVTVGNCGTVKNHTLLLRAIADMRCKDKITYLHVGYAQGETEKEEQLAKELEIDNCVRFVGRADPMPYLTAADVYLMTSLYEGMSIAAMEAIFTGMQALLVDVPGLREFDNKGLRCDYFSSTPEALSGHLDTYVKAYEQGQIVSDEQQSKNAAALYDMEQQIGKYVQVYEKLVEE